MRLAQEFIAIGQEMDELRKENASLRARLDKAREALRNRPPVGNVNTIGYVKWDKVAAAALSTTNEPKG